MARDPNDKILDNSYSAGNVEYVELKTPAVESNFARDNLQESYSSEEYIHRQKLVEGLYSLMLESPYAKYLDIEDRKKAPKSDLGEIYNYLKTNFVGLVEYTCVEFIIAVIEVLDVSYENMFQNLFTMHKAEIIDELDKKYHIFEKKGFNPLF